MVTNRKFTVAAGTLTLPTDVTSAVDTDIQDNSEDDSSNLRQKINRFLNLLNVQAIIVTVVVLDTILVIFLLLMELNIIQEPSSDESKNFMKRSIQNSSQSKSPSDKVQQAEHVMHVIELIILTVFLMEILLRVFARGIDLVYDKWQVFDSLVVIVTFALYVSLTAAVTSRRVTYSVGFLILLRLWRIGRIHYDLTQPVIQKATSLIMAHRRAWRDTEEQLKQSYQQIERQQEKIESLKCKLRALQSVIGLKQSNSSLSTETGLSDGEGCLNNQNVTDSILAAIHTKPEISTNNIRSCSLPSALTSGCLDASSSMSLPSSPKNLSFYHSKDKSVMSHGSSGKIPDLVEHTQGADIYRDPSFKEALTLQALALDRGWAYFSRSNEQLKKEANRSVDNLSGKSNYCSVNDVSHHGNWMAGEQNLGYTAQSISAAKANIIKTDSPKYIKNPDRCACDRVLTQHHREKSASTGALVRAGLSHLVDDDEASQRNIHKGEPQCTTLPRRNKNSHASRDGKHYPQVNMDKIHLIAEVNTGQGHVDYAFSNPSFALCLSPEELERIEREEIQRVSQIPFDQYGSISHLLREGIPISEL